jgi:hypothetical protein
VECVNGGDERLEALSEINAVQIFENGGAKSDKLYSIEIFWVVMIDGSYRKTRIAARFVAVAQAAALVAARPARCSPATVAFRRFE